MAAAAANAGREDYQHARQRNFGGNPGNSVNIEEVVGGMEASGVRGRVSLLTIKERANERTNDFSADPAHAPRRAHC